jgi:hypothetical protein
MATKVMWSSALFVVLAMLLAGWVVASPASADMHDEYCLQDDPPPPDASPRPLRFGNTPLTAGSVGPPGAQEEPVPRNLEQDLAGMLNLRPDGKELVVRMNRMFWADGREGIEHYVSIADRYAEHGFVSESQVRYHPPEGREGDMAAWEDYVRQVAQVFGSRDHIVALSITNEGNVHMSPNTSDGWYDGVIEAIVVGTLAARDELDSMGRQDIELGFSFAWRMDPGSDREFWEELGELATPEFIEATDYVGLQVYPGKVWPTVIRPHRSAGYEVIEALWLMRDCYMPKAGLDNVDLWITENGYGTNLGDTEEEQDERTRDTLEHVYQWSGTLGVTDYRWFNLRDNRSDGTDVFSAVGLLRDDYSDKPAYCTMREMIEQYGTDAQGAEGSGEVCGGDHDHQPRDDEADPAPRTEDEPSEPAQRESTPEQTGGRLLPSTGGSAALLAVVMLGLAVSLRRRFG